MPIQYDYDVRLNLVRARMSGVLSVEEIKRYFARVARDPNVAAGFVEVVDFGGVDDIAFRYPDAQGILDSYRARAASKDTRSLPRPRGPAPGGWT